MQTQGFWKNAVGVFAFGWSLFRGRSMADSASAQSNGVYRGFHWAAGILGQLTNERAIERPTSFGISHRF